jgi:hypothetical protein
MTKRGGEGRHYNQSCSIGIRVKSAYLLLSQRTEFFLRLRRIKHEIVPPPTPMLTLRDSSVAYFLSFLKPCC